MKSPYMLTDVSLGQVVHDYPFMEEYIEGMGIDISGQMDTTLMGVLSTYDSEYFEDRGTHPTTLLKDAQEYMEQMAEVLYHDPFQLDSISLLPGTDKDGLPEKFESLTISTGEVMSIVGPTGSGKSRLLADIEWMARADTPTGRTLLVNGEEARTEWRYSHSHKLVAQLSQNMNFVMDLSVEEFLHLHAESRLVDSPREVIDSIISEANQLAGEKFLPATQITSLSGGQSRALMIADTAILSSSPIVLIDEIENAGIDREKALDLLLSKDKIVLMATHDPLLALMGDYRMVIANGGIAKIIQTDHAEKKVLKKIKRVDVIVQKMRSLLRQGDTLDTFFDLEGDIYA
ncbi:MAG: ATP-binding cassette domain-containing protein [Fibrobacterota bacterium]